jgi:RND family efflux transporter MFP subunit
MPNILGKIKGLWGWVKSDKRRVFAFVAVMAILVIGLRALASRKNTQNQYQTAKVEKGTIVSTISASGKVLTTSILDINTQASGVVAKVYVKDGDKVYSGQALAEVTLDSNGQQRNAQLWASYLSAKSSLSSANTSIYTLQSSMFAANQKFINDAVARGLTTDDPTYIQEDADWKAAEAKYINQETAIKQAQASLTSALLNYQEASPTIRAPFAGTISNVELVEGMVLNTSSSETTTTSSQRVAVIKSESNPIISVSLSEIDVPNVKVGQKATVTFDSIPDKTFTGVVATVDRIGSTSNNVTGYGVNIKLDSMSDEILPNMAVSANIITDSKTDVLLVPSSAVLTQGSETVARVLRNGSEIDVPVETGISSDTQIEITSGLSEGEEVITGTVVTTNSTSQTRSVFGGFGGGAVRINR